MKNVALFVGNDIFSWLVCQDLIAALKGECAFTVYFPLAKSAGRTQEPAVRRLGLYEREVLNDFVFPFVGRNAAACEGAYQPPALFLAAAGVKAHRVLDINDTAFISSLGHMDGVISCAVIRNSPPTMCAPSADAASCSGTCIRGICRAIAG